jgi:hypothetical protein
VGRAEAPRPFRHKTWDAAKGERETSARLDALPPELDFDDDFPEPIRYDAARGLLVYRGFMSYGSFRYLIQLHSDPGYARALDELFRCSGGAPTARHRVWWPFVLAVAGVVLAALVLKFVL